MIDPEPISAILEAIQHWRNWRDVAKFAIERHGYGDSDGGFGVTYPGDLDEYDRQVDGIHIPAGKIRIYGFWGPPDGYELNVSELLYLNTLADFLDKAGLKAEAERVRSSVRFGLSVLE